MGEVHVSGYTRTVDGKVQHVQPYEQLRHSAARLAPARIEADADSFSEGGRVGSYIDGAIPEKWKRRNVEEIGDALLERAKTDKDLAAQLDWYAAEAQHGADADGQSLTQAVKTGYLIHPLRSEHFPYVLTALVDGNLGKQPQGGWDANPRTVGARYWAHTLQSAWAGSASDSSPVSLGLQQAVSQKFGVQFPDSIWASAVNQGTFPYMNGADLWQAEMVRQGRLDRTPRGVSTLDMHLVTDYIAQSPAARAFVDITYQRTQTWLKEHGVKEVTLYRGLRWSGASTVPEVFRDTPDGQHAMVSLNPLSSFATRKSVAEQFAFSYGFGRVITVTISPERIFSIPLTGPGCQNEMEVIVVGSDGDYVTFVVHNSR